MTPRNTRIKNITNQQGFTLIEVLVVVVIAGILASIAITSYRNHVIRSNRAVAESFMMQIANKEEQYMLDARSYTNTLGAGGLNLSYPTNVSTNYAITLAASATPPSYVITATPTAVQKDPQCGTLTLDQQQNKTVTGTGGSVSLCW